MNRENKLAIIIGFSLVLVVAVLISDHFSRARSAEVGVDIKPLRDTDFGAGGLTATGLTRPLGGSEGIPVGQGLAQPEVRPVSHKDGQPDEFTMGPNNGGTEPPAVGPQSPEQTPEQTAPAPEVPGKPYSTLPLRKHEVKDGDKLYSLAEKYYNDGSLWKTLQEYNAAKVPNAASLRVGVTLDIPPKDVLLGEAVLPPAGYVAPKQTPAAKDKPSPRVDREAGRTDAGTGTDKTGKNKADKTEKVEKAADKARKPVTYTVAKGDSLGTIAQKLLGSSLRARELYQLNRDVLKDEHTVQAGIVLKLPSK